MPFLARIYEERHDNILVPTKDGFDCGDTLRSRFAPGTMRPSPSDWSGDFVREHCLRGYCSPEMWFSPWISVSDNLSWVIWQCEWRIRNQIQTIDKIYVAIIDGEILQTTDFTLPPSTTTGFPEMDRSWSANSLEILIKRRIDPRYIVGCFPYSEIRDVVLEHIPDNRFADGYGSSPCITFPYLSRFAFPPGETSPLQAPLAKAIATVLFGEERCTKDLETMYYDGGTGYAGRQDWTKYAASSSRKIFKRGVRMAEDQNGEISSDLGDKVSGDDAKSQLTFFRGKLSGLAWAIVDLDQCLAPEDEPTIEEGLIMDRATALLRKRPSYHSSHLRYLQTHFLATQVAQRRLEVGLAFGAHVAQVELFVDVFSKAKPESTATLRTLASGAPPVVERHWQRCCEALARLDAALNESFTFFGGDAPSPVVDDAALANMMASTSSLRSN